MKPIKAGEAISSGALVACNEEGEAVNREPVKTLREIDAEYIVMKVAAAGEGAPMYDEAYRWCMIYLGRETPDEPIGYKR